MITQLEHAQCQEKLAGLWPLSVVLLTKNEKARVGRCLGFWLKRCSQLVVLDSLSTDGTLDEVLRLWLAAGRDSKDLELVQWRWPGFTKARNESLAWVRYEWVAWVDADEWLVESPQAIAQFEEFFSTVSYLAGRFPRQSYFLGKAIRYGGWWPDKKLRLALTQNCRWLPGPEGSDVHERLDVEGLGKNQIFDFATVIHHEGFRDRREQYETNQSYSSLLAEGLAVKKYKRGQRHSVPLIFVYIRVLFKFFENYIWKRGFLDGRPGLLIALGSAQSLYWRYLKERVLLKRLSQKTTLG